MALIRILLLCTVLLFSLGLAEQSHAQTDTPPPTTDTKIEQLESDTWPVTADNAVADIIARLSPEDKATIRNTKQEDLIKFHFGWGTGIRNYYGLWRGNHQLINSACGHPCHPDDASMVIIQKVWEKLQ